MTGVTVKRAPDQMIHFSWVYLPYTKHPQGRCLAGSLLPQKAFCETAPVTCATPLTSVWQTLCLTWLTVRLPNSSQGIGPGLKALPPGSPPDYPSQPEGRCSSPPPPPPEGLPSRSLLPPEWPTTATNATNSSNWEGAGSTESQPSHLT